MTRDEAIIRMHKMHADHIDGVRADFMFDVIYANIKMSMLETGLDAIDEARTTYLHKPAYMAVAYQMHLDKVRKDVRQSVDDSTDTLIATPLDSAKSMAINSSGNLIIFE